MPTVAIVAGVKIQFYPDEHPPPHFHAVFAEHVAQIGIRPMLVLRGRLPASKQKAVLDWAAAHERELLAAWTAMEAGRKPEKIP